MKSVFTLVSLLMIMVTTFASPADSIRAERRDEGLFIVHEVEEEETIYSIAKRYGGSVIGIIKHNQIVDNRIEIGQVIFVLVEEEKPVQATVMKSLITEADVHMVKMGETLYSISRLYDVKLKDLRKWNGLSDNSISPGMMLRLSNDAVPEAIEEDVSEDEEESSITMSKSEDIGPDFEAEAENEDDHEEYDPFEDFEKYLVQTGETLSTIARKIGVSIDSLKKWNGLQSDYLKIGQQLFYKEPAEGISKLNEPKKRVRTQIDERGFERVYEEGMASVIESMNTTKYLALHRSLPIGTNLEVRNLMNNQVVHVKVVGKLPNTGLNKNLLLRLSQPAYDQLGILDSKSRVEVSHNKQ